MPQSISDRFKRLRERNEKALVCFVTAGDPRIEQLPSILHALVEGGADIIEVGIPFSDPIADGPTIQAASQRALDRITTPSQILNVLSKTSIDVPVVLMGYYNTILRVGPSQFARNASAAGVSGTIVSDIIPEEASEWIAASQAAGLDNIFLAAPTSTDDRLSEICGVSTGFVYAVSRTGVTGARRETSGDAKALVEKLRARTDTPVCVGFGISSPEQVREVCEFADGAVVGSWLVDLLASSWNDGVGKKAVTDQLRALKDATFTT